MRAGGMNMSAFVHMELSTSDVAKAKKFYKSILGWTYEEMPMPGGSYTMVMSESGPVGGMQTNPMPDMPNNWCGYAAVKSVSRTVTKVTKLGGTVIVPKTDLPSGALAVLTDPQGAAFGIWEAASTAPAKKSAKKVTKKAAKKAAKKSTKKAAKKTKKAAKKTKKAAKKTNKAAEKTNEAAKRATKKAVKVANKAIKAAKKAAKKSAKKAAKVAKKAAKKTKKAAKKAKKAAKKSTTKAA